MYSEEYIKSHRKFLKDSGQKIIEQMASNEPAGSIVMDIGFNNGQWSRHLNENCILYGYEASPSIYETVSKKHQRKNRTIKQYGIGAKNETLKITITGTVMGDGSNVFSEGNGPIEEASIVDVVDEFKDENIDTVNLMKINIEGSEYDLLSRLIETNLIKRVEKILVQFHEFAETETINRDTIREKLSETHNCIFCWPYIWEAWEIKNGV